MTAANKTILFLGPTRPGSQHDYALLKESLPPDQIKFQNVEVLVDLGFQGIKQDYHHAEHIYLPYKKQKKSKSNPHPILTEEQKTQNRALASRRVRVEHAIGGMKVFHCLSIRLRNHIEHFRDNVIRVAAGLWNIKIA